MSTPRNILSRASIENLTSLAAIFVLRYVLTRQPLGGLLAGDGLFDHAHDVALFHDQIFDPVDLDLGARPFAEQDPVSLLQVDRDELAGVVAATWTDGDHLSFRRLLFGGIRNDDSACGLIVGVDARNHDAVVKRPELHINPPRWLLLLIFMAGRQRLIAGRKMTAASSYLAGVFLALFKWDCQFRYQAAGLSLLMH